MKVGESPRERAARLAKQRKASKQGRPARVAKASSFSEKLFETQSTKIREELDDLLDSIDIQAAEIEKSMTFESLRAYKELVRKFVSIVVNDLYKVEKHHTVTPTGRKKTHILIKTVDDKLEEMTKEFMNRQGGLLNFMDRLDQIRGMLMDLYS